MTETVTENDVLATPIGFYEGVLGLGTPYPWVEEALTYLEPATGNQARRMQVSLRTPNGAGKSERVVAVAALWWVYVHKRGKVVITSKDSKQLNEQVVPAIDKHLGKFERWLSVKSPYYKVTTPTGGSIHAFVTDEGTRFEGWHKEDDLDGPLLVIIDEAKTVPNAIFEGADRCTWNALLYSSSPGGTSGAFWESQTKHRAQFKVVAATLKDCPHIPKERVEGVIEKYGIDNPFTRSSIFGEFMVQEDPDQFPINLECLMQCIQSPPKHRTGIKAAFCDFGGGTAEHIFATRDGNKATIQAAWRDHNKKASAGRFIIEFRKSGLTQEQIWGDAADTEMLKLLGDAGWAINRKNFGAPANEPEVYVSWGSEAWHETGHSVTKSEVILDNDPILISQLTTRKKTITARGKLGVEEKHEMAKPPRNLPSPDRADAICGVLTIPDLTIYMNKGPFRQESWTEYKERDEESQVLAGVGADAGY